MVASQLVTHWILKFGELAAVANFTKKVLLEIPLQIKHKLSQWHTLKLLSWLCLLTVKLQLTTLMQPAAVLQPR